MRGFGHTLKPGTGCLTILIVMLLNVSSMAYSGSGMVSPLSSDMTFQTLDGRTMVVSEMQNTVILINFWGTWCAPCLEEIPDLIKLSHHFHSNGLQVIGVALASGSSEEVRAFAEAHGMDYVVVIGDMEEVKTHFQVMGFPTSVLIDREGVIRKRYFGPQTEAGLTNDVMPLLPPSFIHD